MVRRLFICGVLAVVPAASYGGDEPQAKLPAPPTNAALETDEKTGRDLVGRRQGRQADRSGRVGHQVDRGRQRGSRNVFPGQPQEMVSVYTVEGPDLIMTHYCVLGNQPRLKADPNSSANQIVFLFAGGGTSTRKRTDTCTM